jgi:hypothetical protein
MSVSRGNTPARGLTQDIAAYTNTHGSMDSANGPVQGAYMNDVTMRGTQYSHHLGGTEFHEEVPRYGDVPAMSGATPLHSSGTIGFPGMNYMPTHDPTRRPSAIDPHSDFTTSTTAGSYDPWASTSGSSNSATYPLPGSAYQPAAPAAVTQSTTQMGPSHNFPMLYEGMARSHDMNHPSLFRNIGPMSSPSNYQDYGPQAARGLPSAGVKQEGFNGTINQ